jgi:DNA-binding NarL/FixJ family response regulator
MEKITLAIIEDIDDVSSNLKKYFLEQEEFSAVITAPSMEFFLDHIVKKQIPDVILSDIGLPGMSGIEGIKIIKEEFPEIDIIMLTVFSDNEKVFNSICSGATGYVLKGTSMPEIKRAILDIKSGGSYMSPSIARRVIDYFSPSKMMFKEPLSFREKQIVSGLTEGLTYKSISDKLSVSVDTVRYYIKGIYKKLHINSRAELINKSLKGQL